MDKELMEKAIAFGRTKWLRNLIANRLPEIIDCQDEKAIEQWDYSIKEFMSDRGLIEPRQQKDYWTDIRNAISTFNPNHIALSVVGLSTSQWVSINNTDRDKLAHRTTKLINDPDAVVKIAIDLLNSSSWADIAAGLATVTGRRCSELLQTAQFDYCSPYSVIFTGATKRRNESTPLKFEIPTLAKAEKVIETIARLRRLRPTDRLNLKQINSKYEEDVAAACHRHFHDLIPTRDGKNNLYTHIFRAVYATIAAHWFCPPTVPVLEFRAFIQGHFFLIDETDPEKRQNIATQRHYFDYQIGDGQGNIDGRLGLKLNHPDVRVIQEFQSFLPLEKSLTKYPQLPSTTPLQTDEPNSNSTFVPNAVVNRLNRICDRFEIQANSFSERLELLADHLEQSLHNSSASPSIDSTQVQQLCDSVHKLSTSIANLTSTPTKTYARERIYTKISPYISSDNSNNIVDADCNSTNPSATSQKKVKKKKINSHAIAHVNHVIDRIMNYNNQPDRNQEDKWRIGASTIKHLTTVDQNYIYYVKEQRQLEIDQHHQLHQLKSTHNQKGRHAPKIIDTVKVIPYSDFKLKN